MQQDYCFEFVYVRGDRPSGGPPPGGLGPGHYPRGRWYFHDYYWFSRMVEDIILGPRYMRYRRLVNNI